MLIAVVITAVGLTAVMAIYALFAGSAIDAEKTDIAAYLAQRRLEELRSYAVSNYASITAGTYEARADVDAVNFPGFQRQVVVDATIPELKKLTITVYWTSKGADVSVPLISYITSQ